MYKNVTIEGFKIGVNVMSGGSFNMYDGAIKVKGEEGSAGVIVNDGSRFGMGGGTISATGKDSIGIGVSKGGRASMSGGTVSGDVYGVENESGGWLLHHERRHDQR